MYICQIASKKLFLYNKKNSDLKINIPKNHKSLSLSSIFFLEKEKKKVWPGHLPKQVTRLDTRDAALFCEWRAAVQVN
jgi:hypothetical protein